MLEDSSLLLQAAAEGQGIALIRSSLAYNDLLSGRVVRLFDVSIACPWLLYFVCAPGALESAKVQASGDGCCRRWIGSGKCWRSGRIEAQSLDDTSSSASSFAGAARPALGCALS